MSEAFRNRGKTFDDADVARCYAFRPPYPETLFDAILARVPRRSHLLDLGTGPGKIAGVLAPKFDRLTAVDPSQAMLDVARDLWSERQNIDWVCATAETAEISGPYDLVTAGASIHWMNPALIFPKLALHLAPNGAIAIIVGDFPKDPPWQNAWVDFVARWTERVGDKYQPENWRTSYALHEAWIEVDMKQTFVHPFSQSIGDFIECQHSRASWARRKLGTQFTAEFDAEARTLLAPYARDELLRFEVETELTLCRPRATPLMP